MKGRVLKPPFDGEDVRKGSLSLPCSPVGVSMVGSFTGYGYGFACLLSFESLNDIFFQKKGINIFYCFMIFLFWDNIIFGAS